MLHYSNFFACNTTELGANVEDQSKEVYLYTGVVFIGTNDARQFQFVVALLNDQMFSPTYA